MLANGVLPTPALMKTKRSARRWWTRLNLPNGPSTSAPSPARVRPMVRVKFPDSLMVAVTKPAWLGEDEIVAVLALGAEGTGARLLSRLTRKSWDALGLADGMDVYAQVKAVALAPGRGELG